MNAKTFTDLGFKKMKVSAKESGDKSYHFYELAVGELLFLSNDSDDKDTYCFLFEAPSVKIKDENDLRILIEILKKSQDI